MTRTLVSTVILVYLALAHPVDAHIAVEILGASTTIYRYEPAYVVFEVRNEGSGPAVIPADTCTHEGAFLEIGLKGQQLYDRQIGADCISQRLVWLPPGGRWLFFKDLAPGAEGAYELEAVLRSPGECGGSPVGPERNRIEPVRPGEAGSRPYDCWRGEARSQRITITVEVPNEESDRAAAEFLQLDHVRWQNNWQNTMRVIFRQLFDQFPTSHYTYAAFYSAGRSLSMLNVVILQPENPLNPWVAGAMAEGLAYRHRPCAPPYRERLGGPPDLAERYQRVIAAYPPPKPVEEYLRQLALEHASEECPSEDEKP